MASSKITLYGLYAYDENLFDNMTMPEDIDAETVRDNILIRGGEYEVLYADPDFMRQAIGVWALKWQRTFSKWQQALAVEYDPLYNYDRHEEWTTTDDGEESRNLSRTESENTTNSVESEAEITSSGTSENKISAYNSSVYEPNSQNASSDTSANTTSNSAEGDRELTSTDKGTVGRTNEQVRTGRAYGNIGVTTSQQMLISELELQEWNLIEHITDIFLQEFTVPVFS